MSSVVSEKCSRRGPPARRWQAFWLGLGCAGLISCGSKAPAPRADAGISPSRYWLSHSPILSTPGGSPRVQIDEPVLVERWPGGRITSIAGATPAFEGYLPDDVLTEPQSGRGLMLIAQEEVDLHWGAPDGPLVGHLYPGAKVSVVPGSGTSVRVGSLPFTIPPNTSLFAEHARLGVMARVEQAPQHVGPVRALQLPAITGWVPSLKHDGSIEATFPMASCRDTLVFEDRAQLSQHARGVELFGVDSDGLSAKFPGANFYESLGCPAHVITELAGRLHWNDSDSDPPSVEVERIPDRYQRVGPVDTEPLSRALLGGHSVYWLLQDKHGLSCDEWQFMRARRVGPSSAPSASATLSATLRRRKRFEYAGAAQSVNFRVTYSSSDRDKFAVMRLDTPTMNGQPALRCE